MKRYIPIICVCAAALLAGCGKTASSSNKTSDPVVKGEAVEGSSAARGEAVSGDDEEAPSGASGKNEKSKKEPATGLNPKPGLDEPVGEAQIATGPREGNAAGGPSPRPPVTIPRPKKPAKRQKPEENGEEEAAEETIAATDAYAAALGGLLDNGKLPVTGYSANVSEGSEFAVADVDGDGSEELILSLLGAGTADSFVGVYGVTAEGSLVSKGAFVLGAEFYSGGLVKNYASHNQGPCGDFQGYSFEKYDPATNCYQPLVAVEAVDKAAVEALAAEAEERGAEPEYIYPAEADISGSGRVYYITSPGSAEEPVPCDVTEYEARVAQILSGAELLAPGYRPLTRENVDALAD